MDSYDDFAISCYYVGRLDCDVKKLKNALSIWKELSEMSPQERKLVTRKKMVVRILNGLETWHNTPTINGCLKKYDDVIDTLSDK